jgi:hypothetical protein
VAACWVQLWDNVRTPIQPSEAVTSVAASDVLARGADKFLAFVQVDQPVEFTTVAVTLISPNGSHFATGIAARFRPESLTYVVSLSWSWNDDHSLFFQHPEWSGTGVWTFRWALPDGETCDSWVAIN